MISQTEFERVLARFKPEEERGEFYDRCMRLKKKGDVIEGVVLLQATWNFAEFRYIVTSLDLQKVRTLIEYVKPRAEEFGDFKTENLDGDNGKKIINLFNEVSSPKELDKENKYRGIVVSDKRLDEIKEGKKRRFVSFGATGTSKLLHMLNPQFFVMWDNDIRGANEDRDRYYDHALHYYVDSDMVDQEGKYRKFAPNGNGYLNFLKAVRDNFVEKNHLTLPDGYTNTFTKAVDAFNFTVMHKL